MNDFSTSVDIEAPPDRVWQVLRDVERWPEWTSSVTSVKPVDPGPFDVGTRVVIRQPKLRPARWRVTELHEGAGFTWVNHSPGVHVVARHQIEPTASGSRVRLSLQFTGPLAPLITRLTRGLNERYLALEARGLKARSEGTAASGMS
jgi:uncharacterized membrane protein